MYPVFKNDELEKAFRRNGFVVIPYFSDTEINEFRSYFNTLRPDDMFQGNQLTEIGRQSFHITFFDKDTEYKRSVLNYARQRLDALTKDFLNGYSCAQANIFLKPPGEGYVYPHQNITIVDEREFTSVSIWIPLQDTTIDNGTLCIIPGSQNYFEPYRNTHVYWPYVKYFKEGKGKIFFIPINVKAGEVLILDDRIVHYTPVNHSQLSRWVFHSLWKPAQAKLMFFDPGVDNIKRFTVADDFWQFHAPGTLITDRHPDEIFKYSRSSYSEDELTKLLDTLKSNF